MPSGGTQHAGAMRRPSLPPHNISRRPQPTASRAATDIYSSSLELVALEGPAGYRQSHRRLVPRAPVMDGHRHGWAPRPSTKGAAAEPAGSSALLGRPRTEIARDLPPS